MPAATTKAALLAVTGTVFGKRQALPDRPALCPGWYADGQAAGTDGTIPAPGGKWIDLKRLNADLRASQSGLTWEAARVLLYANHTRLTAFLGAMDDKALYGAPMKGGDNAWTTGRRAEITGPSHHRSAARVIRARLAALANSSQPD